MHRFYKRFHWDDWVLCTSNILISLAAWMDWLQTTHSGKTEQRSGQTSWHDKYTPAMKRICSTTPANSKWKTDARLYQIHASMASQLRYTIQHLHYLGAPASISYPSSTFFKRAFQLNTFWTFMNYVVDIHEKKKGEIDITSSCAESNLASQLPVKQINPESKQTEHVGKGVGMYIQIHT